MIQRNSKDTKDHSEELEQWLKRIKYAKECSDNAVLRLQRKHQRVNSTFILSLFFSIMLQLLVYEEDYCNNMIMIFSIPLLFIAMLMGQTLAFNNYALQASKANFFASDLESISRRLKINQPSGISQNEIEAVHHAYDTVVKRYNITPHLLDKLTVVSQKRKEFSRYSHLSSFSFWCLFQWQKFRVQLLPYLVLWLLLLGLFVGGLYLLYGEDIVAFLQSQSVENGIVN